MSLQNKTEHPNGRRSVMAALAHADGAMLADLWSRSGLPDACEVLRGPECGLVMLRGRMGGSGSPFNLGDATVTRMTVRVPSGAVGHAWSLGRDGRKARLSALADALWQTEEHRRTVEQAIVAPLVAGRQAADAKRRAETAATKVDFFTMVRGED